jgi:hypothetical protein
MPEMDTEETPTETSDVGFELKPVTEKPRRAYRKGSKYDPILEAFKSSRHQMVEVGVPEKDANYLRTQLNKRIEALKLTKRIKVSVVNNVAYLEKMK